MTDEQPETALGRTPHKFGCFRAAHRQRLLNEDVLVGFESLTS